MCALTPLPYASRVDDMVGRADMLEQDPEVESRNPKAARMDLSKVWGGGAGGDGNGGLTVHTHLGAQLPACSLSMYKLLSS
jgi:hypothetical protein